MAAPTGTRVFIASDYRFACIDIEEVIREGAAWGVSGMQKMGLASWIADSLGIDAVIITVMFLLRRDQGKPYNWGNCPDYTTQGITLRLQAS